MKSIKTILVAISAMIISLGAYAQDKAASYTDQASKKLPKEVSDGLVWQSVAYNPQAKTITFSMTVDSAIVPFVALKQSSDMLKEGKMAEIMTGSDEETVALRTACATEGNTLVYLFTSGPDSFTMQILPADLK